ncbi:hypothetical protein [Achromobacter aloeverae]|uniref:Uncharacterized protein n=1 Tax=Achromobacter aloeverae TaxID=1750518 RepID=A0A4Q1HG46_9BURK|nr:hypothetical protein [Achromobacter aloeverae]RXN86030.1 hypothetical protein C7R54_19950 [Achromobacter aloeverae]
MQTESVKVLESADISTATSTSPARSTRRIQSVIRFAGLFALVWILLDVCYETLPMIRPGADVVLDTKLKVLARSQLFLPEDRYRVLVFGNSKTLAGFKPDEFDQAFGDGVRSYNLGLPGDARFLPILKTALDAGNVPTHVFLTIPWDDKPRPTLLDRLRDEETILYDLIPFRDLPRDIVVFAAASHLHFKQKYDEAVQERDKMLANRGWYYIKGQSYYASGDLPEGYSLPTDHPSQFLARAIPRTSFMLDELSELARRHRFQVVLIPGNTRDHAAAPAPRIDDARSTRVPGNSGFRVIGPDYWVYPPAQYSDPVHMNPQGASAYTRDLARLVALTKVFD